jgi:hypothetical protein
MLQKRLRHYYASTVGGPPIAAVSLPARRVPNSPFMIGNAAAVVSAFENPPCKHRDDRGCAMNNRTPTKAPSLEF